jgi:hypothetical protein
VKKLAASKEVVPVWTIECEPEDMSLAKQAKGRWTTGYCGEVDCVNYCCDRFAEQWSALQSIHTGTTGLLLLHKEFKRDRKEYGDASAWISHAVDYLRQEEFKSVPPQRLWLVVQGYDVTRQEELAGRQAARRAGAGGVIVARTRIDQSFEPRVKNASPQ